MRDIFATAILCFVLSAAQGQAPPAAQNEKPKDSHADCPMHQAHAPDDSASTGMNERGEKGMGFSQTATTHHFFLNADGGVIQVEANDPKDTTSRDNIRMHLTHSEGFLERFYDSHVCTRYGAARRSRYETDERQDPLQV
jgi:hypothetical protein